MNDDLKQETQEEETVEENLTVEKEELESLLKAIEELEKLKEEEKRKKPRNLISIEFGGVFHNNMIINFTFSFILNLTLIYLVIVIFNFANFTDIVYVIVLALIYTFFETIYKTYVLFNHFIMNWFLGYFGHFRSFHSFVIYSIDSLIV